MIPLDTSFDPPALTVMLKVAGVVNSRPRTDTLGLIDTGADITAIPTSLKDRYKLYPISRLQIEGVEGVTSTVYTYEAQITLPDFPVQTLEVILTHFPFVILGRDWLLNYTMELDGRNHQFHLRQTM